MIAVGAIVPTAARAVLLPDDRAYELASPADKNGADVRVDTQRMRVASDGGAITFPSFGAFGDVVGTGVATDYMTIRGSQSNPGSNGWVTHAITPPQAALSLNGALNVDPLYVGDFSADLDEGVFRSWSPVTNAPDVADASNLYVRNDLRSAGAGSYELATPCPLCDLTATPLPPVSDPSQRPGYAGASEDFRHLAFESQLNLTSDATGSVAQTYEWDAGQVRLAGFVPSGTDTSCGGSGPPCVAAVSSLPGAGVGTTGIPNRPANVISNDGSRIFFTVPTDGTGGPSIFGNTGKIYVRTVGTTTDEVTASERTAPDAYSGSKYWGASVDGSRVFFTNASALTDDAPPGGGLYVYDTTRPASDPHNLTFAMPGVSAVIGTSDDGSYIYVIAGGMYLWHDGNVDFIGQSVSNEARELPTTGVNYNFNPPQGRVTPDGRFLLLSSHDGSGFSPGYDHGTCLGSNVLEQTCRELYVYSADAGTVVCASCNPSGALATAEAATSVRQPGAVATTYHLNRAITDDGSRVFFTSGEALLPEDVNGKNDVYQYDVPTGQLHLITSGTDPSDAYFADADPSGRNLFFVTRERLVGWDSDTSYDLYDARIGGGFPEPLPPAASCSGPACQGTPGSPPDSSSLASSSYKGPGDLPSSSSGQRAKKCKRGFAKRRVKGRRTCVKRARRHRRHADRRAGVQRKRRTT